MPPIDDPNPFASPLAEDELPVAGAEPVDSDQGYLITPLRSVLPHRCYRCNDPGGHTETLTALGWMSWTGGAAWVRVVAHLCPRHQAAKWKLLGLTGLLFVLVGTTATGVLVFTTELGAPLLGLVLTIGMLLGAIAFFVRAKRHWGYEPLKILRIQRGHVWASGAGREFLESLDREGIDHT